MDTGDFVHVTADEVAAEEVALSLRPCTAVCDKLGYVIGFYYPVDDGCHRAFRRKDGKTALFRFEYVHIMLDWMKGD